MNKGYERRRNRGVKRSKINMLKEEQEQQDRRGGRTRGYKRSGNRRVREEQEQKDK